MSWSGAEQSSSSLLEETVMQHPPSISSQEASSQRLKSVDTSTRKSLHHGSVRESLGRRGSRRDLVIGMIAGGASVIPGSRSTRAQERPTSVLKFSSWATTEPATRDSMTETLRVFEQIYGARIESIDIPFGTTLDQLLSLAPLGDLPDVMQLSGSWPRELAFRGLLSDLSSLGEEAPEILQSFPGALEAGEYKGVLCAAPFAVAPLGFWYHRELLKNANPDFDQPPKTIAELDQWLKLLKAYMPDEGYYPIRIDVSVAEYALTRFWPWIWTFGGNPMPDDDQGNVAIDSINWTDDGTTAVFEWLQRTARQGYMLPPQINWRDRQLLANGKIGFMLDGPYLTSQIPTSNPKYNTRESINEVFGVTTTPVLQDGAPPVTVADFHQLAISAQSHNQELAHKLVRFLVTNEHPIRTFLIPQGGLLPVSADNTGAAYGSSYDDMIGRTFVQNVAPSMRLPPYGPGYKRVAERIAQAMQDVAFGDNVVVAKRLAALNQEVKRAYTEEPAT
jgi:multiple sugar transport system substrate-binding protein